MKEIQIIGIMLVKNEDVFIERAIRNIVDFCDRIIITDHRFTDLTYKICEYLAKLSQGIIHLADQQIFTKIPTGNVRSLKTQMCKVIRL